MDTSIHDHATSLTEELFKQHGGKHFEILPVHLSEDYPVLNRNTIKWLTRGDDTIELRYDLRSSFVKWMVANQGDFDIIGRVRILSEAKGIKVTKDVLVKFIHSDLCDFHLNHGNLLKAVWSWIGIKHKYRLRVAELLASMIRMRPQSAARKSRWVLVRHQLLQELNLPEAVVDRLERVLSRFCAPAGQSLPRLRRALPVDGSTRKALAELSKLLKFLRLWKIEKNVYIDALMTPSESYHTDLFFQVFLRNESPRIPREAVPLLAVGGRYDHLLRQTWGHEHTSFPPGAVGISIAIDTILQHSTLDFIPISMTASSKVLVCSKGAEGLLNERMELAAKLREAGVQADFLPSSNPSFAHQYAYAYEKHFECLVIITESGKDIVKVLYLEHERAKKVNREDLVRFLLDAMRSPLENPLIRNKEREEEREQEQDKERDKEQGEAINLILLLTTVKDVVMGILLFLKSYFFRYI